MQILSSLKLTLLCLLFGITLVLIGTLYQIHAEPIEAQQKIFKTFFVWWQPERVALPLPLFPGGYLIGGVLVLNLAAALLTRFRRSRKGAGLLLAHLGIILLLLGELASGILSKESILPLGLEGQATASIDPYQNELVVGEASFPASALKVGKTVAPPLFPYTIAIRQLFKGKPGQMAIRIDLLEGTSKVGSHLLSTKKEEGEIITARGQSYSIALRRRHRPLGFGMELISFNHETHPGTTIPSHFSSRVNLYSAAGKFERSALITMNHPLVYRGKTFYQFATGEGERLSILQVVENPAWPMPYLSCSLVAAGLLYHFSQTLLSFVKKKRCVSCF